MRVRPLSTSEVTACSWAGSPLHLAAMREAIARVDVHYLALLDADEIVCVGGIDFSAHEDAGTMWQLCCHPARRGQGLGSAWISAAEALIAAEQRSWARLGVEDDNHGARRLYERLGYERCAISAAQWPTEAGVHHATIIELRKRLGA